MRYLKLLTVFYKYSVLKELEYRVNFFANAFMTVFWVAWSIVSISIFFQHRDTLGDWTYNQVLIVVGLFTFFHGVLEAFL
ncbi:MAG: ABC-2 family transporter protein, partial [Chloroflexi bacterium]|nr:ABC-2 family transporter protein [Chloroflexota bacterium]